MYYVYANGDSNIGFELVINKIMYSEKDELRVAAYFCKSTELDGSYNYASLIKNTLVEPFAHIEEDLNSTTLLTVVDNLCYYLLENLYLPKEFYVISHYSDDKKIPNRNMIVNLDSLKKDLLNVILIILRDERSFI